MTIVSVISSRGVIVVVFNSGVITFLAIILSAIKLVVEINPATILADEILAN